MIVDVAANHFLGQNGAQKRNCAQSVLCGFKEMLDISEETIDAFAAFGGGRVPGGTCGAIYAAEYILDRIGAPEGKERLKAHMEGCAGSVVCKEIKEKKQLSCLGCVKESTEVLVSILCPSADLEKSNQIV